MIQAKRLVVVTGGSRGIGRAIVTDLARAGYDVVFSYANSGQQADELASELAQAGGTVTAYRCDGRDVAAVQGWAADVIARHGTPHAVINNAGVVRDALLVNMSDEQWRSVIGNNIDSAFHVTRAFIKPMLAQGSGVILQLSSVSAFKGNTGQVNYAATKAALIGMTRSLALEVARFNVRVNAIAPGYIATEMVDAMPQAQRKAITSAVPLRRMGEPREVAALARFLLSDDAAYITGQTYVIDGGLSV
jgi:3-oxoacyl-[acyl-carrier protein] reductase